MLQEARSLINAGKYYDAVKMYEELWEIGPRLYLGSTIINQYEDFEKDGIVDKYKINEMYTEFYEIALKEKQDVSDVSSLKNLDNLIMAAYRSEVNYWKNEENFNRALVTYYDWLSYDRFSLEGNLGFAQLSEKLGKVNQAIDAYNIVFKLLPEGEGKEIEIKIRSLK